jgi:hypothetical protein
MADLRPATAAGQGGRHESPLTDEEAHAIFHAQPHYVGCPFLLECGQGKYDVVENSRYMGYGPDMLPYIKGAERLDKIAADDVRVALSDARIGPQAGAVAQRQDIGIIYPDGCLSATAKCMGVVIEGVVPGVIEVARKATCARTRQLGKDICRVGLPRTSFEKIFQLIGSWSGKPAVRRKVQQTPRYIWVDADWGTVESPMRFQYREEGELRTITEQLEVHELLQGSSVVGLCEVQLHLSAVEVPGSYICSLSDSYSIGVSLQSMVAQRCTPDRGPARTTSAVLQLSDTEIDMLLLEPGSL